MPILKILELVSPISLCLSLLENDSSGHLGVYILREIEIQKLIKLKISRDIKRKRKIKDVESVFVSVHDIGYSITYCINFHHLKPYQTNN